MVVAVRGCLEPSCGRHPERRVADAVGNFCSGCGGPIGPVHVRVEALVDLYDVVGGALSSLDDGCVDVAYMVPNVRRGADPRIDSGNLLHEEHHVDLRAVDVDAEVVWFETAFAPELTALRAACAAVAVKWGLHTYFG